jgi:CRISPR/Cas system-associated endonuclease Cas3-HD
MSKSVIKRVAIQRGGDDCERAKAINDSVTNSFMSESSGEIKMGIITKRQIASLEEIEAKVDEEKARDQRIRDAIERLKRRAEKADIEIAPVNELILKVNVLTELCEIEDGLSEILSSIASDLRRLDGLAG